MRGRGGGGGGGGNGGGREDVRDRGRETERTMELCRDVEHMHGALVCMGDSPFTREKGSGTLHITDFGYRGYFADSCIVRINSILRTHAKIN